MKSKPLTTIRLSVHNLQRNPFRTACLIFIVMLLSFTTFGGSLMSQSLRNGLGSLKERLGADLAVVPLDHEADYEGILLSGEPEKFYFDQSIEEQIEKVEGIDKVSSQFFISTLAAACCSVPVQVIGFDPDTDFVIQPWIAKVYREQIGDGQIIAGSDIVLNDTGTLQFFDDTYQVVAQLEKTSTGMDYSVYANMNTIKMLVAGARAAGMNLSVDVYGTDVDRSVSTVLVKIKEGYDADEVTTNIRRQISGISIVKSQNVFASTANNMDVLLTFIHAITLLLWLLAVFLLAAMFLAITNGRKKELALLRSVGATRGKICGIVLMEAFTISVMGGLLGTAAAVLILFPFSTYTRERLGLPYLLPNAAITLRLLGMSLLLSFAAGPLAAAYAAVKGSRAEVYASIREGG
ncbi:ABC transporter permease [Kineothrix sedimenti]|uniref:Putative hemin transport system permease protein HrtB n=1 Tax=Kineothrix sedimenti TaxID=3123317 RepID=A0ABZ3EUA8_9FIRM